MTRVGSEPNSPPRLSVVEETQPAEDAVVPRKRGWLANWLLLAATLLFAWLWLQQLEQTRLLADERSALHSQIGAIRAEVVARDAHLQHVRSEIDAVASQIGRLQHLSARVPAAAPLAAEAVQAPPDAPLAEAPGSSLPEAR